MDDRSAGIRPDTYALEAWAKAVVEKPTQGATQTQADTVLFLGPPIVPARVIEDPVLAPVDKLIWMVLMLHTNAGDGRAGVPNQAVLCKAANIGSTSTIARAKAILRATRWLTQCARLRDKSGRHGGVVYALHELPWPLHDTLYLDPGYLEFLQRSLSHSHAHVRAIVRRVVDMIDAAEQDHRRADPTERSSGRIDDTEQAPGALLQSPAGFSEHGAAESSHFVSDTTLEDHVRKSNMVNYQGRNSNMDSRSSSHFFYKNAEETTPTTPTTPSDLKHHVRKSNTVEVELIYPQRLTDNQCRQADQHLAGVSQVDQQALLDELEGRFRAEARGMDPVYDPLNFLRFLCRAARRGKFVPNLGERVRKERIAQGQRHRPALDSPRQVTPPSGKPAARSASEGPISLADVLKRASRSDNNNR